MRSQVGSQHEIETTLGLEEEACSTHTGSFELPSTIQTDFAHPAPVPGTDSWVDELQVLKHHQFDHEGDQREGTASWNLTKSPLLHSNPVFNQIESKEKSPALSESPPTPLNRKLFGKNDRFGHIQKTLSSLNSAKTLEYGSKFFGTPKWYSDDFNVSQKMQTNDDRRKFRFGLKSNVDFLIQLDIENLIYYLTTKGEGRVEDSIPKQKANIVSDGSFANLMKISNGERSSNVVKILERLRSNLNFTQLLAQHFAMDDMIEPVTCVINEALRKGPDLGASLRGGTVASCAQVYRHMASKYDHDKSETGRRGNSFRRAQYSGSKEHGPRNSGNGGGYCFEFQDRGKCTRKSCYYKHNCEECGSTSHGSSNCSKKHN